MRAKKYSVSEFRVYHDKFVLEQQRRAEETLVQYWDAFFIDSGWSFEDVISVLHDAADNAADRDFVLNVISGMSLANGAWRHWFFMDFPNYVRDLGMKPDQAEPFPWVMRSWQAFHKGQTDATDQDSEFRKVPWRVAYYWCRLFYRQCAKYFAHIFLKHYERHVEKHTRYAHLYGSVLDEPYRTLGQIYRPRDHVHITGGPSDTRIVIANDEDDSTPVVDVLKWLTSDSFWAEYVRLAPKSMPFLCFLAYRKHIFYLDSRNVESEYGTRPTITNNFRPNIGYDRERMDAFSNFNPEDVETFIRWYCHTLEINNPAFQKEVANQYWGGQHVLGDTVIHNLRRDGPAKENTTMESAAKALGLYDGKDHWPHLESLPLCPVQSRGPREEDEQILATPARKK